MEEYLQAYKDELGDHKLVDYNPSVAPWDDEPVAGTDFIGQFTWARRGGYECSSKGDKRFSAFNAVMPDGRTIEQHYQCDVKGYQPGGTDWRLGKGKPPLDTSKDLWKEYLKLWQVWAVHNPKLIDELRARAIEHAYLLSDCFASTDVNQARALAHILNYTQAEPVEPVVQEPAAPAAPNIIANPCIAIIGTAGRDKDRTYNLALWQWMVRDCWSRLPENCTGVSGGAAWADHLAVALFCMGRLKGLKLHLPAPFDMDRCRFVGEYGSAGGTANYYHEKFSRVMRENTLAHIALAIQKGAQCTWQPAQQGFGPFKARNTLVARDCTGMLAYTFGEGDAPADGGTRDTWDKFHGEKIHIALPR